MPIYDKPNTLNSPANLTANPSFAMPMNFRLTIDGLKYKNVMFSVQRVTIPDITAQFAQVNYRTTNLGVPADKIAYSDLELSFMVDEDFTNYREVHDWLFDNVAVNDSPTANKTKDISLIVLSSHYNPVLEFKFVDAYPTNLGAVQFDSTVADVEYLVASATFKYSYFRII
jgi:hypothetical protein